MSVEYFLKKLYKYLPNKINQHSEWLKYCSYIRRKYPILTNQFKNQKKFLNSYYFITLLSKNLSANDVIVTDMGLSLLELIRHLKLKGGRDYLQTQGMHLWDWGLPSAIGAFYASKIKNIICITGEGGLQLNIQELATVMHHKIPLKIFIYNNGGYLTIKQTQQLGFEGRIMGADKKSGISFPNYKDIAKAHKIKYIQIFNNDEAKSKISYILSSKNYLYL